MKTVFHVAPRAVREAIAADNGLWCGESEDLAEEGIYLFDNLPDARRFQEQHKELGETDVWELVVDPEELLLVSDPLEDGGWRYDQPFLEPASLNLVISTE